MLSSDERVWLFFFGQILREPDGLGRSDLSIGARVDTAEKTNMSCANSCACALEKETVKDVRWEERGNAKPEAPMFQTDALRTAYA